MIAGLKTPARRALVVELVGPAGAGKSVLLQALGRRDPALRAGLSVPVYAHALDVVSLLPTFVALHRPYKGFFWKEMKRILYLETCHRILQREASRNYKAIILDEGPIYMLGRLHILGRDGLDSPGFTTWWQRAVRQWAATLDAVVWLDAEDPVLARRIRTRNQPHVFKDAPDETLYQFFECCRAVYEEVTAVLTSGQGPRTVSFATDQEPIEEIADKVLAALEEDWTLCRPPA